jgi:hypothetical protein
VYTHTGTQWVNVRFGQTGKRLAIVSMSAKSRTPDIGEWPHDEDDACVQMIESSKGWPRAASYFSSIDFGQSGLRVVWLLLLFCLQVPCSGTL